MNPFGRSIQARRLLLAVVCCAAASTAVFHTYADDPPDGIQAGLITLQPNVTASYEVINNVFREEGSDDETDTVVGAEWELIATLPFRNSRIELSMDGDDNNFQDADFDRDRTENYQLDVDLEFGSGDRLKLRESYRRDFARTAEEGEGEAGERPFEGEPFNVNRWEIELSRSGRDRQGYLMRVRRQDLIFQGDVEVSSFEFRGFENFFEYRHPLPGGRAWTVGYQSRRFNHYEPSCPRLIGRPFRKEEADNVQSGLRGTTRGGSPYRVSLGYGEFSYDQFFERPNRQNPNIPDPCVDEVGVDPGPDPEEFGGVVGAASFELELGGRTDLALSLARRPLPSSFETYYINQVFRAEIERDWRRQDAGVDLSASFNRYGERTARIDAACFPGAVPERREDTTLNVEAYWSWLLHERLALEVSSFYERRRSNCDPAEYEAAGFELGLSLGWF